MSRVADLDPDALPPEQRQLHAAIAGPRGGVVRGPFAIWMRNPGIAEKANLFGNELRIAGKLEKRLFELVVLTVARRWSARYEWFAHEKAALDAGLSSGIVECIRNRQPPPFDRQDERLVHQLVTGLSQDRALSDATYDQALAILSLDLLIELVTSTGFCTMVAMTLRAFDAPASGGRTPQSPGEPTMDRRPPRIRRVVTGHDAAGRAAVWRDGDATNHKFPGEKASSTLIWVTDAAPTPFLADEDAGERIVGTAPPATGTRFCVMEFEPGNEMHGTHRTDTTDYVACLAGEIDMDLDEGTVTLRTGDVMVQRGTNHVWVNRSDAEARLAVVLIDGQPKRPGSVGGGECPMTGAGAVQVGTGPGASALRTEDHRFLVGDGLYTTDLAFAGLSRLL